MEVWRIRVFRELNCLYLFVSSLRIYFKVFFSTLFYRSFLCNLYLFIDVLIYFSTLYFICYMIYLIQFIYIIYFISLSFFCQFFVIFLSKRRDVRVPVSPARFPFSHLLGGRKESFFRVFGDLSLGRFFAAFYKFIFRINYFL